MKNYTITVNGNVYDVTVEESGAAPVAAPKTAPKAAPKAAPPLPAPRWRLGRLFHRGEAYYFSYAISAWSCRRAFRIW